MPLLPPSLPAEPPYTIGCAETSTPKIVTFDEFNELRERFREQHVGTDNAFRTPILPYGIGATHSPLTGDVQIQDWRKQRKRDPQEGILEERAREMEERMQGPTMWEKLKWFFRYRGPR